MTYNILALPGDGIGPEVAREAVAVLRLLADRAGLEFTIDEALIGGACLDKTGFPITDRTLELARQSDAVLLGAVGGPRWDGLPHDKRPEQALLKLRSHLGLYANLRPVKFYGSLANASPLKAEIVEGIDIMVIRELTGGLYFGVPRGIEVVGEAPMSLGGKLEKKGFNTEAYTTMEIERIAYRAFESALHRRKKVTSVDKANIL